MNIPSLSSLTKKIGIDLGSSSIRIWSYPEGIVVNEPACLAVDQRTNKVIAVGKEAKEMQGRLQQQVVVHFPLQQGVIVDADLLEAMLRVFFQKIIKTSFFFRPILLVSVPSAITESEKLALTEVLFRLGVREVNFIDQLLAAAIGAGLPVADASGSFLMQFGAGLVETGIVSLGSLVLTESSPKAGNYLDLVIQRVLKQEYSFSVGTKMVELIKQKLISAIPIEKELPIQGQDLTTGVPKEVLVSSIQFHKVLEPILEKYVTLIKKVFEQVPPELTSDVVDKGILLTGGMAQLTGLDTYLVNRIGVPISVVDEPDLVVIKGISQVLQNLDLFRQSVGYKHESYQNG